MELWATDGTAAGTTLAADIWPGSESSGLGDMAVLNDRLYFGANDGSRDYALWATDGTGVGTTLIVVRGAPHGFPRKCPACGSTKVASILYGFPAYDEKMQKDLKDGKIVLGGCCVNHDDPVWQCAECDVQIYRKD